ncbi:GTPase Era [Acinetobacter soli]|uniref:GTPase Era n=3 Tax=Acinetobacter soli TaxID=487316 RepID=A0A1P8EF03_9GAMM|nr:GTPase Era [Acinetobacter soli]ENV56861.1 GTP-binding protein Era [Acinetobacter soli CIP 110264]ENV59002.1 GTP-binding protein Era [Acinetobacter soli NIPH 2899]KQC99164.1 GTPase Era [Acinetobacter soli]PPB87669.1 GTPase Era [Acinetobacter soli]
MSMHSDQINPDSHDNDENQSPNLIDQFFSSAGVEIPSDFRSGFVAIVGRPNVGKSTLMNHLLGQKLSITSRKPQTTRHKIVGIDSREKSQAVYVDTPGMHKKEVRAINKMMNRAAHSALRDVNLVLFVVDGHKWTQNDDLVLEKLKNADMPVIMVINKIDTVEEKRSLLPLIQERAKLMNFAEIIPVSALRGANLDHLRDIIEKYLPFQPPLYSFDQVTDRSERFLASEIIREKIMRQLGEELPYDLTVQIESFKTEEPAISEKTGRMKPACTYIDATIFVERAGQKAIVIGDKGAKLKRIGMEARTDMEKMFEQKIMLTLWVKVKGGWSDDERALKSLGYSDI